MPAGDTLRFRRRRRLFQKPAAGLAVGFCTTDTLLLSVVLDSAIERGNEIKGRTGCTVGRDNPGPCCIDEAARTGNKRVSAMNRNSIYGIERPASLILAVNFITVCCHNLELTRNSDGGTWG